MEMQPGKMEQRKHQRVSAYLNVSYRALDEEEKELTLNHPFYRQTTSDQLPYLAKKFNAYRAVTKNISEGGVAVSGEFPFVRGDYLEISLQLPECKVPVKFLAEVVQTSSFTESGKVMYSAGVKDPGREPRGHEKVQLLPLGTKAPPGKGGIQVDFISIPVFPRKHRPNTASNAIRLLVKC